jgi:hypothetical protein
MCAWFTAVTSYPRRITVYALTALLAVSVFLPNVTGYFVADDWSVIARNVNAWQEGFRLLTHVRYGWYRPVFDLFIALCWKLFGLNPVGYHVTITLLYAMVSVAVGILAELMTDDWHIGLFSTALFAIHGSHAEPVLWIASANELVAGLFVVSSLAAYVAFRKSGRPVWLLAAWLSYLLGIASKETAIFLPLMLIVYDLWLYDPPGRRSLWHTLVATGPLSLVGAMFAIFRLLTGSPYPTAVSLFRVVANLAYYAAVEVLALPDNYGYLTALPLWVRDPLFPIFTVGLAAGSLTIIIWLSLKLKFGAFGRRSCKVLVFAALWSLVALSPVILTATGRTAFLSSIGVTWSFAIFLVLLWQHLPHRANRRWVLVSLVLLVSTNLLVSGYRVYWWRRAGDMSRDTLVQLSNQVTGVPINRTLWLIGLPDHVKHAYIFRNAFPAAGRLLFPAQDIRVALDVDVKGLTRQRAAEYVVEKTACTDCVIFWYKDGVLERIQ